MSIKKYMDLLESASQNDKSQEEMIKEEIFLVFQQEAKKHFNGVIESSDYEFVYNGTDKNSDYLSIYFTNDNEGHQISINLHVDLLKIEDESYSDEEATGKEKQNNVVVSLNFEGDMAVLFETDIGEIEITSVPVKESYGLVVKKESSHLGTYWDSLLDTKSEQDIVDEMNAFHVSMDTFFKEAKYDIVNYIKMYYGS